MDTELQPYLFKAKEKSPQSLPKSSLNLTTNPLLKFTDGHDFIVKSVVCEAIFFSLEPMPYELGIS